MIRRLLCAVAVCGALNASAKAEAQADPLNSPMWDYLAKRLLPGAPIVFDERVKVVVPAMVENQSQAPVAADARAVARVEKLIVFADLNPVQHILTLRTQQAAPYVAFRMKVEQGTPVRAAAFADGVWHVGSAYLDAMGGGCSTPALARKDRDWHITLGQTQGRLWREENGFARMRLRIRHPMDTGLTRDNTPAFFIETLELRGSSGEPLAALELFEPISEDPTLTLSLNFPATENAVTITARDNNGGVFTSTVRAEWRDSRLAYPDLIAQ